MTRFLRYDFVSMSKYMDATPGISPGQQSNLAVQKCEKVGNMLEKNLHIIIEN